MPRHFGLASRHHSSFSARRAVHLILLLGLLAGYAPAPAHAAPPEPLGPAIEEPAAIDATGDGSEAGVAEFVQDPPMAEEALIPLTIEEIEAAGSLQAWPAELPPPPPLWPEAEQAPEGLSPALYLPLIGGEGAAEGAALVELGEDLPDAAFEPSWDEPLLTLPDLASGAFVEETGARDYLTSVDATLAAGAAWSVYRDLRYGYGLAVAKTWTVFPTPPTGQLGAATIQNYLPPQENPSLLTPAGAFKLDLVVAALSQGQTALSWWQKNAEAAGTVVEAVESVKVGSATGIRSTILDYETGSTSTTLLVQLNERELLILSVYPQSAWLLKDVQDALNSFVAGPEEITELPAVAAMTVPVQPVGDMSIAQADEIHPCGYGNEVPLSPITLHMPFSPGTRWTVGGSGSYYGDGMHVNNDYYATDWNMGGGNDDNGQPLYPVAPGTVTFAGWDSSGYGNMVLIEHGGNPRIRTRYAHLEGISVSPGQGVELTTQIGTVGHTGGNWYSHLHLSFQADIDGGWKSQRGVGRRPSPMETAGGSWDHCDGQSATVANKTSSSCSAPQQNSPNDGETLTSRTVSFSWQSVNCGQGFTFRVKDTSNMDSGGTTLIDTGEGGTSRTESFGSEWDNKDLYWGVKAANTSNAQWSVRRFRISPQAPPNPCPQSTPNVDQAIIFADTGYGGACAVLGIGEYPNPGNFGSVGNDNASSIRVGSDVRLTLCLHDGYQNCETFENSDDDLGNNGIGNNNASSAKVERRLFPPGIPSLASPDNGAVYDEGQAIVLSWNAAANAKDYFGEITGGPSALTFGWQGDTSANIGSQWAGYQYTWHVKAGNGQTASDWSESRSFIVRPGAPTGLSATSPSCGNVQVSWGDASGNEEGYRIYRDGNLAGAVGANVTSFTQNNVPPGTYTFYAHAYRGNISSQASNSAQVTVANCAPIARLSVSPAPATQVHTGAAPVATRFTFQETAGTAVSIGSYTYRWYSANGSVALSGPIAPITLNLNVPGGGSTTWSAGVQLPGWVVQKAADRGESAVRLHFTFNGADSAGRTVSAATYATLQLSACGDTAEPNNATANAKTISYGQTLTGVICPAGDLDLYKFSGAAGDRLRIAARQRPGAGTLNPMLELLASDGRTVVAANNDRAIEQNQTDSRIAVVLPSTGLYYLRITDAARRGGVAQSYDLLLHKDTALPSVAIRPLAGGSWVHATQQLIRVDAGDRGSEVDHVQFFAMLPDGQGWKYLGSDFTAADGWYFRWYTAKIPPHQGSAIYAYAFDGANNYTGVGLNNLGLERTAPTVRATAGPVYGDAPFRDFIVAWRNGYDGGSGIASYDVQVRKGATGVWTDWLKATTLTTARYVGIVGYSYYFRARAQDKTGTTSAFAGGNGDAVFTVRACPASADNYEADNSAAAARSVRSDGSRYWHNFHYEGDHDWVKFYARTGTTYTLRTYMEGKHADTVLTLYNTDGKTVLATNDDSATAGGPSQIAWKAPATGIYFARISHHDPYGYGCTTAYHIGVTAAPAASGLPATAGGDMADQMVDGELAPPGDFAPPQEEAPDETQ